MTSRRNNKPAVTGILDLAERNRHVARESFSAWFSVFQEVVVSHDGIMTPGVVQGNPEDIAVPMMLTNYAFTYFIAAIDTCMSGQVSPCFALLRMCIESSVYAHAIARTPELRAVWTQRDTSPAHKQVFNSRFKIGLLMDALPDTGPAPREAIRILYNRTISYGGHPNPGGAPSVGRVEATDKYVDIGTNLFSGGRTLLHALMITAHVGNVMVCLQDLTFNVELAPTGLVERIEALSQAFFQKGTGEGGRPTEEHQS